MPKLRALQKVFDGLTLHKEGDVFFSEEDPQPGITELADPKAVVTPPADEDAPDDKRQPERRTRRSGPSVKKTADE